MDKGVIASDAEPGSVGTPSAGSSPAAEDTTIGGGFLAAESAETAWSHGTPAAALVRTPATAAASVVGIGDRSASPQAGLGLTVLASPFFPLDVASGVTATETDAPCDSVTGAALVSGRGVTTSETRRCLAPPPERMEADAPAAPSPLGVVVPPILGTAGFLALASVGGGAGSAAGRFLRFRATLAEAEICCC